MHSCLLSVLVVVVAGCVAVSVSADEPPPPPPPKKHRDYGSDHGASPDMVLKNAALTGNTHAAKQAIEDMGADINSVTGRDGQTALMAASLGGHDDLVAYLLESGADWTIPEKDGYTPMHGAAFQGRVAVAKVLHSHGVPLDASAPDGIPPFHRTIWGRREGHVDTMNFFLDNGVPVDVKSKDGLTGLMWACQHGKAEVVFTLLEKGANPNAQDNKGQTPLHYLLQSPRSSLEIIHHITGDLEDFGADPDVADIGGTTPKTIAKGKGMNSLFDQHDEL